MSDIAAFVIAGGQSSRMGQDKAFLALEGVTLLERALAVARAVTTEVAMVGPREKFSRIAELPNCGVAELRIIEDVYPGQGPLAGIHAALRSSACELNLMIGVDTPFLDARFVSYLLEQARESGAVVTVPVTEPRPQINTDQHGSNLTHSDQRSSVKISGSGFGQHQPLCAVYRREFAVVAEAALQQQRNNIVPLFAQVATREIPQEEMRRLAFDARMFDNLNTPEEWTEACRRIRQ